MIEVVGALNTLIKRKAKCYKTVWVVMVSYRDALDDSETLIFSNYSEAKKCFNELVPDDKVIKESEYVRCQVLNDTNVYDRKYYIDHDYFDHWTADESLLFGSMSYYISIEKKVVKDIFDEDW